MHAEDSGANAAACFLGRCIAASDTLPAFSVSAPQQLVAHAYAYAMRDQVKDVHKLICERVVCAGLIRPSIFLAKLWHSVNREFVIRSDACLRALPSLALANRVDDDDEPTKLEPDQTIQTVWCPSGIQDSRVFHDLSPRSPSS